MNTGNFDTKQRQSINSSDLNRSAKALNSKMVNGVFQVNYFLSASLIVLLGYFYYLLCQICSVIYFRNNLYVT